MLEAPMTPSNEAGCPALNLPLELLGETFFLACLRSPSTAIEQTKSSTESYIDRCTRHRIASTCRFWREVSVATKPLWSYIAVVVDRPSLRNDEGVREDIAAEHKSAQIHDGTEKYDPDNHIRRQHPVFGPPLPLTLLELSRSGQHPLHITLQLRYISHLNDSDALLEPLRIALPRCHALRVSDHQGGEGIELFLRPEVDRPHHFPLLRSFVVHCPSLGRRRPIINLSKAPQLQHLSLFGSIFFSNLSTSSLVELALDSFLPEDIHGIIEALRRCDQQLKRLRILDGVHDCGPDISIPPISLPSLAHLSYCQTWITPEPSSLLTLIDSPNLQYLRVDVWSASLGRLRYSSTLRVLEIDSHFHLELFLEDLQGLSSLEELNIMTDADNSECLMGALLRRGAGPDSQEFELLPCLRMYGGRCTDLNLAENLSSVRNRGRNEGPGMPFVLRLLTLFCGDTEEVLNRLRKTRPYSVQELLDTETPFDSCRWNYE